MDKKQNFLLETKAKIMFGVEIVLSIAAASYGISINCIETSPVQDWGDVIVCMLPNFLILVLLLDSLIKINKIKYENE